VLVNRLRTFLPACLALCLMLVLAGQAANAQTEAPEEALAPTDRALADTGDPDLEARVRSLSYKLRCLVCQNESVAESRAPLAVDLRNQVREQLASGKDEEEVVEFLVARYGDFVLYRPPFRADTLLLWLGPGLLLLIALSWLWFRLRRREQEALEPQLSAEDHAQARALLQGDDRATSEKPEDSRS